MNWRSHRVVGGGGVQLHVVESGNPKGRPVVLLHGLSQSHLVWRKQLGATLGAECRLVALDLRGHGWSDKPRDAYHDPQLWADDLAAVLQHLALERPVLCAWSYGSAMVGDYLRVYGDGGLGGLHFVSGVTGPDVLGEDWLALEPRLFQDDVEETGAALQTLVRLLTYRPMNREDFCLFFGFNSLVPNHVRQALLRRPERGALPKVDVPVLITHGAEDRLALAETAVRGTALFPQARVSLYPDVGHMPFWEEPLRFNREFAQWLQTI